MKATFTHKLLIAIVSLLLALSFDSSAQMCGTTNTSMGSLTPTTSWQNTASTGKSKWIYWSFSAIAGNIYNFSTCGGPSEDTYLRIYNSSNVQVAAVDDYGPYCSSLNSSMDWTCPTTGTYYIHLCHYPCVVLTNNQILAYKYTSCTTPGTPVSITGTASNITTANLSWAAGTPLGGGTITYYWVVGTSSSVTYGSGVAQSSTTGTTATATGLSCNTTYYLRVYAQTGCNSTSSAYGTSAAFTTPNVATPSAVTATPASVVCGSASSLTATSTGNNIDWYTASSGGTLLNSMASGGTYSVTPASTTTYYAEAINGTCINSTRTAVVVTVTPPATPTSVSATPASVVCGSTSQLNATSAGNSIKWYTVSSGGTEIGTSTSAANFAVTPASTTTYYAEAYNSTCTNSTRTAVVVTVTPPATPTSVSATPASVVCSSTSQLNATSAGNSIKWYTVSSGGAQIGTSTSGANYAVTPASTTTYYAEAYNSTCTNSTRTAVVVTVTPPAIPTSVSATPASVVCGSTSQLNATSAGNSIKWYTVSSGGTEIGTSASAANFSVTPASTTTYYAEAYNSSCTNSSRTAVVVTVTPPATPTSVSATPASVVCGSTSQLNATSAGNNIKWYTVSTGGTQIGTSSSGSGFAVTPASTTTYYAEAYNSTCTNSTRTAVVVTVTPPATPASVSATPASVVCGSTSQLNATSAGNNIKWYTVSSGGIEIGASASGANYGVTPASTTTYYAEAYNSSCTNSTRTAVVVTVTPPAAPASVSATPASVVCGSTSQLNATSAGSNIKWYTVASGGIEIGTSASGANYGVTPASTTTYYAEAYNSSCTNSTRTAVVVTVTPPAAPVSVTATPSAIICGQSADLSAVSTGNTINWYLSAVGGIAIANTVSGATLSVGPAATTTYYAEAAGTCNSATRTAVTLTVNAPAAPTPVIASPALVCIGSATDLSATSNGFNIKWYDAATEGNLIGSTDSGEAFNITANSDTIFYAEAYLSETCLSATRTPVSVTTSTNPVAGNVTGGGPICPGNLCNPMVLSGYSGTINKWEVSTDNGSSWSPITNTSPDYATILDLGGTYYFRADVGNGACPSEKSGYAEVTVPSVQGIAEVTENSITCNILSPNNWVDVVDAQNNLIVSLFDTTGHNSLGATMATLTIDPTVNYHPVTGEPYMQRHVHVEVTNQGPATVKLYFTTEDLAALMAVAPYIQSANDLAVTKVSDMQSWSSAKYFPDPIITQNDPFPGIFSVQVEVSEFSEFFIHGKGGDGPLPIELISFDAQCQNGKTALSWVTATENNNEYFTIESTTDMENWTNVARIGGAGNSNHTLSYSTIDETSHDGIVYYRLRQTDYDGQSTISPAIPSNCKDNLEVNVNYYPNPCRDELMVAFNKDLTQTASVMMYDASAKVILARPLSETEMQRGVAIINVTDVIPGVYTVEFITGKTKNAATVIKTK